LTLFFSSVSLVDFPVKKKHGFRVDFTSNYINISVITLITKISSILLNKISFSTVPNAFEQSHQWEIGKPDK